MATSRPAAKRRTAPAPASASALTTRLRAVNAWREWSNPVRGLTVERAVDLATAYTRGEYADLMYLLAAPAVGVESRDALLGALMTRRESALESLDWRITRVNPKTAGYDEALAAEQESALRSAYERLDTLQELIRHLAAAPFRGFAAAEIRRDTAGLPTGFSLVQPWNIARDGLYGDFYYNPDAVATPAKNLAPELRLNPSDWILSTDARPVHGVALLRYVRENFSERDWAFFCEIYGIPGGVVIGPPSVPPEKEGEYESAAESIARGGSGYLPHGADYKANGYPAAGAPFKDWMEFLERRLVLRATGGLLSVLAANTGVGGGGQGDAHADAFATIALADARRISALLNRTVDRQILDAAFPGRPRLAYWSLLPEERPDTAAVVEHAAKLASAGYRIDPAELSEKTGYAITAEAAKPDATTPPRDLPNSAREQGGGGKGAGDTGAVAEKAETSRAPAASSLLPASLLDALAAHAAPIVDLAEALPDPESDPEAYRQKLAELREQLPDLLDPSTLADALDTAMRSAAGLDGVERENSAARTGHHENQGRLYTRTPDGRFADKIHGAVMEALRSNRSMTHDVFALEDGRTVSIGHGTPGDPASKPRSHMGGWGLSHIRAKHPGVTDEEIADTLARAPYGPHETEPDTKITFHGPKVKLIAATGRGRGITAKRLKLITTHDH